MLPIVLALVLLLRVNHDAHAKGPNYQQHQAALIEDIPGERLLSDSFAPFPGLSTDEGERLRRCTNFKFGSADTLDTDERSIIKEVRTAYVSSTTLGIPRECLDIIANSSQDSGRQDLYELGGVHGTRRRRQSGDTNDTSAIVGHSEHVDIIEYDSGNDSSGYDFISSYHTSSESDADTIDIKAALESFWNVQGTKASIRQAQAKTMKRYMDPSFHPCQDFYRFACGNWEKLHPIPKDKAGFDTFEMLRESLDLVLKQILESSEIDTVGRLRGGVVDIQDNYHSHKDITQTDVVANPSETVAAATPKKQTSGAKIKQEELKEKAEEGLKRIVNRRSTMGRRRQRRQVSHGKKKRLISLADKSVEVRDAHRKARDFYQSCINAPALDKRGIEPLLKLIESFGGWPVLSPEWSGRNFDWLNQTAHLRRYNNDLFIVEWIGPDIRNSDENIIQFDQTSLGLPTREYFLQSVNSVYLQAYQRFMADVMHKLGAPKATAEKTAAELIHFETKLAAITSPADQRLNVTKIYKRMTIKQLHESVPEVDWTRYLAILQDRKINDTEEVVIYAMIYMQELVALLAKTEPRTVANYLLWRFIRHRINNVDDRFEFIKQDFYHTLFGREESPPRWKICVAQVNANMGMALGSMFVGKYFDENSKRDTLKMTKELQQAFREILNHTDWIDSNTKMLAELKVNEMSLKIGYPDYILNPDELNAKYAGIEVHPDKYFENTLTLLLHTASAEHNKLHEPVNKTTWETAPAMVNAYYSRNKNQIMFPAGILQPPFYHRHFPRSLNFGGIGIVIGHELTHGFDDKGRLFDRYGNINKWWKDDAIRGFDERARCIIRQYSNYTVREVGIALNGGSTQGENIADNGGLRQAFHAYRRWLKEHPQEAMDEYLPGINMTPEQLFFLNFGQVWCGAMRPEAIRNKLNTAIHSPGRFRVIGTLSNSKDFADVFHCPLGSPMNPPQKCSVW